MIGGLIKKALFLFIIGSIVVAVTRGAGTDASSWGNWLSEQHTKVNTWIDGVGETVVENLPENSGETPATDDAPTADNDSSEEPSTDSPQPAN